MTDTNKENNNSPQSQPTVYIKPPRDLPPAELRTVVKGVVIPPKTK